MTLPARQAGAKAEAEAETDDPPTVGTLVNDHMIRSVGKKSFVSMV